MGKTGLLFGTFVIVLIALSLVILPKRSSLPEKVVTPVPGAFSPEASESGSKKVENINMPKTYPTPPAMTINPNTVYVATMETSSGLMRVRLDPKLAPVAVNSFVFLAREGFYDQTVFHRIIKGFMVQGGDPTGTGRGSPGYRFDDEPVTGEYTRGTIAMANSGPNTNGSQFFLMHQDYNLPKNYVIFGRIDPDDADSLATLDALASLEVTDNGMGEISKPASEAKLISVKIEPQE